MKLIHMTSDTMDFLRMLKIYNIENLQDKVMVQTKMVVMRILLKVPDIKLSIMVIHTIIIL